MYRGRARRPGRRSWPRPAGPGPPRHRRRRPGPPLELERDRGQVVVAVGAGRLDGRGGMAGGQLRRPLVQAQLGLGEVQPAALDAARVPARRAGGRGAASPPRPPPRPGRSARGTAGRRSGRAPVVPGPPVGGVGAVAGGDRVAGPAQPPGRLGQRLQRPGVQPRPGRGRRARRRAPSRARCARSPVPGVPRLRSTTDLPGPILRRGCGRRVRSRRLRARSPGHGGRRRAGRPCRMSQIDASDFSSLKHAVEQRSNEELVGAIQEQDGGVDGVLDKVFAGMASRSARPRRPASRPSSSTTSAPPTAPTSTPCGSPTRRCEIDKGRAESRGSPSASPGRLPAPDHRQRQRHAAVHDRQAQGLRRPVLRQTYQSWFDRPQGVTP